MQGGNLFGQPSGGAAGLFGAAKKPSEPGLFGAGAAKTDGKSLFGGAGTGA